MSPFTSRSLSLARPSAERILVTGGTGGLGQALLPLLVARGFEVSALYRSSHPDMPEVEWLQGDVTDPGLGLGEGRRHFSRFYHAAGLVSLTDRDRAELLRINTRGTCNVVGFCQKQRIPHLLHVSTAYVDQMVAGGPPRNAYEMSKFWAEAYVQEAAHDPGPPFNQCRSPLKAIIFRPSILVPNPGLEVPHQGFLQVVLIMAQVHRRAEMVRRRIEGTLRLPPLEPLFRLRGAPDATLNVVSTQEVARALAGWERFQGNTPDVVWLTHPAPPVLKELTRWIGEILMLRIEWHKEFRASPIEAVFHRLVGPFTPYFWGADLPSDMGRSEVDEGFIRRAVECLFSKGVK